MKVEKNCQYCNSLYLVREDQKERSKFCSDECFRKSRNTQVDYNCDFCNTPIKVRKSQYEMAINQDKKLFCSKECANNFQKPKWDDITSLFESRGYILISEKYINAKTKLEYICPEHKEYGSQYITYNNLKCGFGCKYCGIEKTANSRRLPFEKVKEIFARHDMILLEQNYINANTPMGYICKHHKEFGVQYMALSNAYKQYCPYCNVIKGEEKISQYLVDNNIQFTLHKSYDDLRGLGGGKLSYDFYLPNFNLLIEYQGEQHERPVELFGGSEQFDIQNEHDRRKKEYAKTHNINLLEIWYYDFKNIEDILNKKILSIT